ncbi:transposase [Candidatus Venteria ishoeyi]|uniref:Transposase DDE domain protein n=1 Tax=Candidatus Venteria ishoeyi TaxID=1899563 RepID=A0A1H6F7K6_9GAMM|nr:transposase [Candidatus Venteria ishoeyi]SEH06117.1 Transposase DDE domain protein [Candidatus Venteria ishoeyi]
MVRGQETIFLILVTPLVTIPVGYAFYQPDPAYTAWVKEDNRMKKLGTAKALRPEQPTPNPEYPSKQQVALTLLEEFCRDCPYVTIKLILADALYGTADFMDKAALITRQSQVISQLRHNQNVCDKRRKWKLDEYFKAYPGVPKDIPIRGGKSERIIIGSARLNVEAHGCMRFVIAIRYPEQKEYRYLVASDLSWRTDDIVKAYTLRWLVETVIEDLKVHEGWGKSTKQPGVEGSRRVLILSLLCDHCLILHPEQQARAAAKEPLYTIGSLQRHLKLEAFTVWLEEWLEGEGLDNKIVQLTEAILPLVPLQKSDKHMTGHELGKLEPTPGLKYRIQELQACIN